MEPEFGVIEIGHIWFGVPLQRTTTATWWSRAEIGTSAWYAITDDEWPAIRRGYERWLAPETSQATRGRSGRSES